MKNNSINTQNAFPNNGQINNTMRNVMPNNMQNNTNVAMANNVKGNVNMIRPTPSANMQGSTQVNKQVNNNMNNNLPTNTQSNANVANSKIPNAMPTNKQNSMVMNNNMVNKQSSNMANNVPSNTMQSNINGSKQSNNTNMNNSIAIIKQNNTNVSNAVPNNAMQANVNSNKQDSNVNMNNTTAINKQNNSNVNNAMQSNITGGKQSNNTNINNSMANNTQNSMNYKQQSNGTPTNVNNTGNKLSKQDNIGISPAYTKNIDFNKMPVVDAVNKIIITAVNVGASDIHFDPTDNGITVRLRIDGLLNDYFFLPFEIKQNATTRIKIMAGMNITETRLPQDGGIRDKINGRDLDLRVSSLPTKRGEKIVIRILDYSMSLQGVESLCFSETNYNKILKMLNNPNGIILVTGATGTGKSTTLYSFLQKLNVEGTNIITVEDPVEMDIAGINQVQVNSDIGLDFAAVLRSILRQDPNIIMVGEIRDSETAKIAVRASITGHLVLSTIHTNNSLNTIERLLDMDVERYLLASALTGIVSQQLARKLCDKCKTKRPVNTVEKSLFKSVLGLEIEEVFEPNKNGCPNCNRGYKGRVALQEVLLINQDIRDAISSGMRKEQLRELVYNKDVITMLQDGLYKVMAGFTTSEEVLKLIEVEDEDFGIK